jgi:zinc protease
MPVRLPASVLAGLTVLGPAAAGSGPATSAPPRVELGFQKYTLPNGLEVILREDHRLPIVAVNLWYHVGPANETAGRTGFAHLFEHMMFQGSGHVGDDQHFKLLEGAGASMINGTTDFDRTNYMEDIPANQLELALWLESDRMGFLLDRLDQAKLSNQQDVVRNERRQSVENQAYGLVEEELFHRLFPGGHPYYASVIGSHADIQAAKLEDVKDFFRRYYAPNNASLAIVGDIDVARTKALVEKYFGSIPRGPAVPPVEAKTPPITSERRAVVPDKVELPRVYLAWITPSIFQPGDAEADLTARILGGSKASRLYRSLVFDKKIAQTVTANQQNLALGSVFQITATAKPGHTAEELEKAIDAELSAFAAGGPTPEEVAAAQNAIYSSVVLSLENYGSFAGVANRLNLYNHFLHDPGYLNRDLARYAAVTPASLKAFAEAQLRPAHRVVVHGVPGEKALPPNPPASSAPTAAEAAASPAPSKEPWRNDAPRPGPTAQATLPAARSFRLPNGLTVYWIESHALPIVAGQLVVRSGSAADPAGQPGLAAFTAAMLDEGTRTRDALAIASQLEGLGANLTTGSTFDGSYVTFDVLKPNAEQALAIVSDVALGPTFPEKDVERVRGDRLTTLLQQRDSPFQIAFRVMYPALYGPDHPYGHTPLGTEEALKKITRDDIAAFYRSSYAPANAALVLAGDLTEAEARRLATQAFGGWSGQTAPTPAPPAPTSIPERVVLVDMAGAPQTAIGIVQLGVKRSDPDFERLNVMNTILGGLFSSRVNLNLREKHGYTYGAFSSLVETRGVGPLFVGSAVRADVTGASVREMLNEAQGMTRAEVTPDELALAKDSIARSLPALFETTRSAVGTAGQLFLFDLPPDYYAGLPARLASMTAGEVFAATRRHLAPDRMLVVAVGDRAQAEPQIGGLKLGSVAYRDRDGKAIGGGQ